MEQLSEVHEEETKEKDRRTKKRRAKPIKTKLKKFKMMYLNIRGLKCKMESLKEIIETESPTVLCLAETHLKKEDQVDFDGYLRPFRNERDDKDGGGLLILVKKELKNVTIEVGQEKVNGESIWILINNKYRQCGSAIRIGLIYAPQESRTKLDVYKEMYKSITEQVQDSEKKGQKVLIVADFNCKIGKEIEGNKEEVTKSAKYLLKLERNHQLKILNKSEVCKGKWSRVEGEKKSILDYVLMKKEDEKALLSMLIDEDKVFAPGGINEEKEAVYSDHNTVICEFDWLFEQEKRDVKQKVITTKGYQKISQEIQEKNIKWILKREGKTLEERYTEWKEKVDQIIEKNKTVVKRRNKNKTIRKLMRARRSVKKQIKTSTGQKEKMIRRMKLINEHIKEEDNNQYRRKINKVVNKLRARGGINGANTWEVLNQLKGRKVEKATAVRSKNGKVLEDPEEIRERQREHFQELLQIKTASSEEEKVLETNVL